MPKSIKPISGIKGMDVVLSNLKREISKLDNLSRQGLIEATILIRRDMDKTSPKIPVDTGNLRQSWFNQLVRTGKGNGMVMGFTANYAVFVHEMMDSTTSGKKINWNRPGSGPKFFEAALKRNASEIIRILAKNMRIR